ncbi:lipoprotein [Clostridium sardiniense]|uniref:LptM family lipoprotein n=1 Tax=Clostridium sardiniense TaxID=29369 RepID=UPI00195A0854|nr:DUF5105 domain-containing protein [Clostridium sardiniense]MBM7836003.1 hypothetical protein [Clostridium sardiniense]
MKKIIALLLTSMLAFTLVACGGEKPSAVVDKFYTALKECNKEELKTLTNKDLVKEVTKTEITKEQEDTIKMVLSSIDFKIMGTDEKDNEATVDVEVTAIDGNDIATKYIKSSLQTSLEASLKGESEEEITKKCSDILIKLLNEKDLKKSTQTIKVNLEKVDGEWKIKDPENVLLETFNLKNMSDFFKEFSENKKK